MLKPYNYSYSKIQKVQSFLNHVMLDVIFNAKNITDATFSSTLVLPKYRNLIDGINNDYVLTPLSKAYVICKTLNRKQIKLLKTAVHNNNKIRELCNGEIQPVKYDEIETININLKKAIKTFCDCLYDYCIKKVLTQFHTHRSALDHYLPRKHYPFNSLNFKNLIPICDICNGKYKLSEDTLYITNNKGKKNESKTRTVAFYPYSRTTHDIEIDITFNKAFDSTIEPEDIEIDITSTGNTDKITSWDRIFGIKENFKAECCTDEMRMYYEEQYIADMNFGKTHNQYIDILERNKYGDMNFLKIPFLEAINK